MCSRGITSQWISVKIHQWNESNKAEESVVAERVEWKKCKSIRDYQVVDMIELNKSRLSLSAIRHWFTYWEEDGRRWAQLDDLHPAVKEQTKKETCLVRLGWCNWAFFIHFHIITLMMELVAQQVIRAELMKSIFARKHQNKSKGIHFAVLHLGAWLMCSAFSLNNWTQCSKATNLHFGAGSALTFLLIWSANDSDMTIKISWSNAVTVWI